MTQYDSIESCSFTLLTWTYDLHESIFHVNFSREIRRPGLSAVNALATCRHRKRSLPAPLLLGLFRVMMYDHREISDFQSKQIKTIFNNTLNIMRVWYQLSMSFVSHLFRDCDSSQVFRVALILDNCKQQQCCAGFYTYTSLLHVHDYTCIQ